MTGSLGGMRQKIWALSIIIVHVGVRQRGSVCEKWASFEQGRSKQIG